MHAGRGWCGYLNPSQAQASLLQMHTATLEEHASNLHMHSYVIHMYNSCKVWLVSHWIPIYMYMQCRSQKSTNIVVTWLHPYLEPWLYKAGHLNVQDHGHIWIPLSAGNSIFAPNTNTGYSTQPCPLNPTSSIIPVQAILIKVGFPADNAVSSFAICTSQWHCVYTRLKSYLRDDIVYNHVLINISTELLAVKSIKLWVTIKKEK